MEESSKASGNGDWTAQIRNSAGYERVRSTLEDLDSELRSLTRERPLLSIAAAIVGLWNIFSGIAALIIAMTLLRKFLHLEEYLHPVHFQNLGKLLLMMSLLWGYFVFAERLTVWYGNEPSEMAVFWVTQSGSFSPLYWTMVICNFVIPVPLLGIKRLRTITGCFIASCGVLVGMWLERFLIVVPSLSWSSKSMSSDGLMPTSASKSGGNWPARCRR